MDTSLRRPSTAPEVFHDPASAAPGREDQARFVVECMDIERLADRHAAWSDLCQRTIEPNVFLEPGFALPLLQHAGVARQVRILRVWEDDGPASFGRLMGVFPLVGRPSGLRASGLLWALNHKQATCGLPLVDRDHPERVFDAVLEWLARAGRSRALLLPGLAIDGSFYEAMAGFCRTSRRRLVHLEEHRRAVLRHGTGAGQAICLATKRRREIARQARRLSEIGTRLYTSAESPPDVAAAIERFLLLERSGWKGAKGTALIDEAGLATFTRTMTRLMSHEGKCRIDAIELAGQPIAMGIVLRSGDRSYFWKTAFDESYKSYSPGVQLTIELSEAQLRDPSVALTDSCAVPDHPMIDRLWADRMPVADLMIAVRPGGSRTFAALLRRERLRRDLRRRAKRLWHRLKRRPD